MNRSFLKKHAESGGILGKLLLWLVVLFALGAIAWILFLPKLVAWQIHAKTGFSVTVDRLSVNPFTADISIQGMVLKNPSDWPTEDFVELREFRADADLKSLFSNRIIANEVVLDIARFTLVKNEQGAMNAKVFSDALAGKSSPDATPAKPQKGFLIRHLVLKFGKLVYADHSGSQPLVKEYDLKLNQELRDVDSMAKIVKPIANASIGTLTDLLKGAANGRTDLLKDATEAIKNAGKKTSEKFKAMMDALDKKKP